MPGKLHRIVGTLAELPEPTQDGIASVHPFLRFADGSEVANAASFPPVADALRVGAAGKFCFAESGGRNYLYAALVDGKHVDAVAAVRSICNAGMRAKSPTIRLGLANAMAAGSIALKAADPD